MFGSSANIVTAEAFGDEDYVALFPFPPDGIPSRIVRIIPRQTMNLKELGMPVKDTYTIIGVRDSIEIWPQSEWKKEEKRIRQMLELLEDYN